MALNGSEMLSNPFDTFMSVYTDIIGQAFYLIPISIIGVALYIKTRNAAVSGIWFMMCCLMVGTAIFSEYPEMAFVYYVFTVISLVGTVVSIYMEVK